MPEKVQEKPDLRQYGRWLQETLREHQPDNIVRARYDALISKAFVDVSTSALWTELVESLQEWGLAYESRTGYQLFIHGGSPELHRKPFASVWEKTFRKNVLHNDEWPEPPSGGWILPHDCFGSLNDLLRTTLVVKYLDGVEAVVERLNDLTEEHGIKSSCDMEARPEGYYAAHYYLKMEVDLPDRDWGTSKQLMSVEIQVATQLQDVIRKLTHSYYERRRAEPSLRTSPWQWDYGSSDFSVNYLGHILHYVEGMVMEIRSKEESR